MGGMRVAHSCLWPVVQWPRGQQPLWLCCSCVGQGPGLQHWGSSCHPLWAQGPACLPLPSAALTQFSFVLFCSDFSAHCVLPLTLSPFPPRLFLLSSFPVAPWAPGAFLVWAACCVPAAGAPAHPHHTHGSFPAPRVLRIMLLLCVLLTLRTLQVVCSSWGQKESAPCQRGMLDGN